MTKNYLYLVFNFKNVVLAGTNGTYENIFTALLQEMNVQIEGKHG
jgi:hypothetical protein